jgi:hypothetical protein
MRDGHIESDKRYDSRPDAPVPAPAHLAASTDLLAGPPATH